MKCMFCDSPATVHLTDIVNKKKRRGASLRGVRRKRNLIPEPPGPQIDLTALMNMLMTPFKASKPAKNPRRLIPIARPAGYIRGVQGRGPVRLRRTITTRSTECSNRCWSACIAATQHDGKQPLSLRRAAELEDAQGSHERRPSQPRTTKRPPGSAT